jgi:PAS domain S-box-containing protein
MFEESSAWSSLEPEIRDTLAAEVRRALAKRSRSGALIYFVSAVILALSTSYFQEHPAMLVSVAGLCILLGAARIVLATVVLRQLPASGRVTNLLFSGSIYATVSVWGLFCGLTLQLYPLEWTAMFLLLVSAALAGGLASSLAPGIGLAQRCLFLLVSPTIVSAIALGNKRGWALAGLASLYLVFLMSQAQSTWRAFWNTSVAAERERLRGSVERRRAEEERAKLANVIEQAVEEIVFADDKGTIQYCNRSFENGSGYSREEAVGRNPKFLQSGKHDAEFYRTLWSTISGGRIWAGRFINRKKDGSLYELEGTISAIHDASGKITGYVSARHDITPRLQLESQLRQAQKMESIGKLAGGVAHDFNNLLMVIRSYTELIEDDLPAWDSTRKRTHEIMKAVDRAAGLTGRLLAYSRKQITAPVVLNLNAVISETAKMLRRVIGEDIEIRMRPAELLWPVKADPDQIVQILMNLCVNARDAMPQGGTLTIETVNARVPDQGVGGHLLVAPGNYVGLAITDTGMGINKEVQQQIFEPFFTTKEVGKGTGLGLATVYGIVNQSGGYVWVESEPGQGSCFTIYWPCIAEAIAPQSSVEETVRPGGTETILVAEDEAPVREVMCEFLRSLGYTVLAAGCGQQALLIASQHDGDIDLLLTDVVMPKMSGRELSNSLGDLRPNLKTVFMSGYTDDSVLRHGVQELEVSWIQKPFGMATLAREVRKALDRWQIPGGRNVAANANAAGL